MWEGQTLPAVWEWVGARRGKGWLEGSVILFCNMLPSTALGRSKCSIFHSRCNFFFFFNKNNTHIDTYICLPENRISEALSSSGASLAHLAEKFTSGIFKIHLNLSFTKFCNLIFLNIAFMHVYMCVCMLSVINTYTCQSTYQFHSVVHQQKHTVLYLCLICT